MTELPDKVDRLIVHQFDPKRPSPGGIDTCIRGILRYASPDIKIAVVGVDATNSPGKSRVGNWEKHNLGGADFWFLPVAALDPADQRRRIPHSLRLIAGLTRNLRKIPKPTVLQVHRMDSALSLQRILPAPQAYFIHTQEAGLTGQTSDSFWRYLARQHERLERKVVRQAKTTVVYNEEYSRIVANWGDSVHFSPTWYDPAIVRDTTSERDPHAIIWVGRLERPKDPSLALQAAIELMSSDPDTPWSFQMLGTGTLLPELKNHLASLPTDLAQRVTLRGRVSPEAVGEELARSGIFLMTSHPGYEGYPRVLVEAMASGLPCVVTDGSDTGGLVKDGVTGYVTNREPTSIASRLSSVHSIDANAVRQATASLQAPAVVAQILSYDHERLQTK
jgi:glycosyltransferase involved in cell wall biosynthesis